MDKVARMCGWLAAAETILQWKGALGPDTDGKGFNESDTDEKGSNESDVDENGSNESDTDEKGEQQSPEGRRPPRRNCSWEESLPLYGPLDKDTLYFVKKAPMKVTRKGEDHQGEESLPLYDLNILRWVLFYH